MKHWFEFRLHMKCYMTIVMPTLKFVYKHKENAKVITSFNVLSLQIFSYLMYDLC